MKIGVLAGLLEKPADELVTALNVTDENDELSDEIVVEQIKGLLDSKIKETKRLAKDEGKGWGTKETSKRVAERLKVLGAEGEDLDSMLEDLSTKVNSSSGNQDEKTKRKVEQLQAKNDELLTQINNINLQIETENKNKVIIKKINPLIANFNGTEKAKNLALSDYLKNVSVEIDGEDVNVLDKDGKYSKKTFEDHFVEHFSELFDKKETQTQPPKNPTPGKNSKTTKTRNELLIELRSAKTPEDRASIQEALNSLDKN